MAENQPNFNDTLPAAPSGKVNVKWQADAPNANPSVPRNVSAYVPNMVGDSGSGGTSGAVPAPASGDATAGKFLKADATWAVPAGGGGGGGTSGFSTLLGFRRTTLVVSDGVNVIGANPSYSVGDVWIKTKSDNLVNEFLATGSPWFAATSFVGNNFGNQAGICGQRNYDVGNNIHALGVFALARITNVDLWFVFASAVGPAYTSNGFAPGGNLTPAFAKCAGFRFSTSQGDTHYQAVTSDGSSMTVVDTGITPTTNPVKLLIVCDDSVPNIKFYVDGVLGATITTHLPPTHTGYAIDLSAGEPSTFFNPIIYISHIAVQCDV
jgi:hypothetical protein